MLKKISASKVCQKLSQVMNEVALKPDEDIVARDEFFRMYQEVQAEAEGGDKERIDQDIEEAVKAARS